MKSNYIIYKQEKIEYEIIKSRIKNMYIHVKEGKVIVKIPLRLKEKQAEEFIQKKSKWIYEKLKESKKQKQKEEEIEEADIDRLKEVIDNSIRKYSEKLKLVPNKVRIRDIKYAWGSCSSKKNITINLKLAKKEEKIIEYVVLHELCHLKYMNHSKNFWELVEHNMPDYKVYRKRLKNSS